MIVGFDLVSPAQSHEVTMPMKTAHTFAKLRITKLGARKRKIEYPHRLKVWLTGNQRDFRWFPVLIRQFDPRSNVSSLPCLAADRTLERVLGELAGDFCRAPVVEVSRVATRTGDDSVGESPLFHRSQVEKEFKPPRIEPVTENRVQQDVVSVLQPGIPSQPLPRLSIPSDIVRLMLPCLELT